MEVTTAPAQMGGSVSRGPAFLLGAMGPGERRARWSPVRAGNVENMDARFGNYAKQWGLRNDEIYLEYHSECFFSYNRSP